MEEEKVEVKKDIEPDFIIDISDEKEVYTIRAYNNETRPIDKQMRIHIKPLSGKDLAHMASLIKKDIELFQRQNPKDKREFMDLYNMFNEKWEFQYRIEKMENFKFRINGEEVEFTSPSELYEYENSKVVTIVAELRIKFMQLDMLPVKKLIIAFLLWVEGNAGYKDNPLTRNRPHLVSCNLGTYSFKKGDIKGYMTSYFYSWVKLWRWYKKGHMPYNKGWLEQPWKVTRVIEIFDRIADEKGIQ